MVIPFKLRDLNLLLYFLISLQNLYVSDAVPSISADVYLTSHYGGEGTALGTYQHIGPWMSCHQEMPPVAAAPGFLAYGGEQQHHDSYGIDVMISGPAAPSTGFGVLHHHHHHQGHYGGYEYSTWESRKQQKNLSVPHYGDSYLRPFYQALRYKLKLIFVVLVH